jgi:hypothetical protein
MTDLLGRTLQARRILKRPRVFFVFLLCTVVPRPAVASLTCSATPGQFVTTPSPPLHALVKVVQNQTPPVPDGFTFDGYYFTLNTNYYLIAPNAFGAHLYLTDGSSNFDLVMGPGMYNGTVGWSWTFANNTWRYRDNTPSASVDVKFSRVPSSVGAPANSVRVRVIKALYLPHVPFNFTAPLTVVVALDTVSTSASVDCATIAYSASECAGSSSSSIGCHRP